MWEAYFATMYVILNVLKKVFCLWIYFFFLVSSMKCWNTLSVQTTYPLTLIWKRRMAFHITSFCTAVIKNANGHTAFILQRNKCHDMNLISEQSWFWGDWSWTQFNGNFHQTYEHATTTGSPELYKDSEQKAFACCKTHQVHQILRIILNKYLNTAHARVRNKF